MRDCILGLHVEINLENIYGKKETSFRPSPSLTRPLSLSRSRCLFSQRTCSVAKSRRLGASFLRRRAADSRSADDTFSQSSRRTNAVARTTLRASSGQREWRCPPRGQTLRRRGLRVCIQTAGENRARQEKVSRAGSSLPRKRRARRTPSPFFFLCNAGSDMHLRACQGQSRPGLLILNSATFADDDSNRGAIVDRLEARPPRRRGP